MGNIRASVIFNETVKLLRQNTRRIVHQGGQSSGKTVNILLALAVIATESPVPIVITVTSMSFPHLKAGALRDFERWVLPGFVRSIKSYHKTDHIFTFTNGSIIEFKTYETEFDARGAKRKILFVNEANTFDYMTWWQLDSRSELSILDYNPTVRFWAHEKVIPETSTKFRISDHRHNPFLTEEKHKEIEAIADKELYKVYARGLTGNVTGLIYPDWRTIDELPTDIDNWIYAIDYGYTNDPTAIVRIGRKGKSLFIDELVYQVGSIPPQQIKRELLRHEYDPDSSPLYSEHDPDMIKQLRLLNITVIAARKGSGSLKAGIEKLKEFRIFYTASSRNIRKELSLYVWQTNDLGDLTNVPIDSSNHALDAIRYGVYSHFYRDADSFNNMNETEMYAA
jgi:phage terminase large subunit